jgi:hypothetical protein
VQPTDEFAQFGQRQYGFVGVLCLYAAVVLGIAAYRMRRRDA